MHYAWLNFYSFETLVLKLTTSSLEDKMFCDDVWWIFWMHALEQLSGHNEFNLIFSLIISWVLDSTTSQIH